MCRKSVANLRKKEKNHSRWSFPGARYLRFGLARTLTRHRIASTTLAVLKFLSAFRAGVHRMKDEELGIHRSLVSRFAQCVVHFYAETPFEVSLLTILHVLPETSRRE